jgi:hypothetical protein
VVARRDIARIGRELAAFRVDVLDINEHKLEDGLDLLAAPPLTGLSNIATIHINPAYSPRLSDARRNIA